MSDTTKRSPVGAGGPGGPGGGRGPGGPGGGGPMGAFGRTEKANDFKGAVLRLSKYIGRHRIAILLVTVLAVAGTALSVVSPKIMGSVTNQLVSDYMMIAAYDTIHEMGEFPAGLTGKDILPQIPQEALERFTEAQLDAFSQMSLDTRPGIDMESIGRILLLLVSLYVASSAFSYLQGFVMSGISAKVTYSFRRDLSKKLNRLPLRYFDSTTHGDVLSRVTNDVDTVSQTLSQSLSQMVTSIVTLAGVVIMMLSISWQLTLVTILMVPISLVFIGQIVSRSQKYFVHQQKALGDLNGHIEEHYGGHSIVRVFGAERRAVEKFREINGGLYKSAWLSQFLSGLMMPVMGFVGNLGYVGVCVFGGLLAANGTLQIGDIQAFMSYVRQFTQPLTQLATVMNTLQSAAAAGERVFKFLDEPDEIPDAPNALALQSPKGEVTFDNVVFGYDSERPIIKGFSQKIHPGCRVAIVGPTGAGKTTIVNLLMRFYDVDAGSISVDGADIRSMKRANLRSLFGMVLQDTWLFGGTIRENILYAKQDATEEQIEAATHAAQVDHFIHSMPGGYEMELNEEATNISQGQKQLLTIARAMLVDPPILILDEATSSVDTRTEVLIQKAMNNLMQGRTSFIIAHRLSTIRDADLILVLKDGNIIEQGTHEQLLDANGFYSELYNSQFAG